MEPNSDFQPLERRAASTGDTSTENSAKSRILERIKAQMDQESLDPGDPMSGTSIYLKAPDWP